MKFCENCDNMLYLKIVQDETNGEAKSLNYTCKNCNNEIEHNTTDSSCIFKIDYNIDNIKKQSYINPFIYEDITLPRAEGIKCPHEKCPKAKPEIIYIKYDNEDLKFIYICLDCYRAKNTPHIW
jgi:DNA-directed RNA polymerase subunit M/transcription elongation factor TFIIS